MNSDSLEPQPIRALSLLSAITMGNATIEDLAMELRQHGFDYSSLQFRRESPQELDSSIVQRVPQIPFVLNGIMHDPKDIIRFNGQELHFVLAPAGDHLLVVDNRTLLKSWLELAYHEQYGYRSYTHFDTGTPRAGGFGTGTPDGSGAVLHIPLGGTGPHHPHTLFWEHINAKGASLYLRPGRGYKNLKKVSMGIFGNWNDEISSVTLSGTSMATLYEHINWEGQTLNLFRSERDLHRLGWGDRASAVSTH